MLESLDDAVGKVLGALDKAGLAEKTIVIFTSDNGGLAIKGGGPQYTRIGRRALYRKADVLAWAAATGRTVENTAQLVGAAPKLATVTALPAAAKRRAAAQVEA